MVNSAVGILIFLSVCGVVISNSAIDCRKFVFAPFCRGIGAKRGSNMISAKPDPLLYLDEKSLKEVVRNIYTEMALAKIEDEENEHTIKSINKLESDEDENEKLVRKYNQNTPFHKYLLRNKRISSETDSLKLSAEDFENL